MTPEHKALVAARAEVDAEHAKVNGDDGYNYAAGQECGLRLALIVLDKHLAAIETLSAQCAQPQAGEVVAWRYKLYVADVDWTVSTTKPKGAIVEPLYASPQPANPAQVTDAEIIEIAVAHSNYKDDADFEVFSHKRIVEFARHLLSLTAAIGAGGQAVAVKPLEWVDADEGMCTKWRAAALGGHYELVDFGKDDPGFAVNFHWGRPLSFWFIQGEPDERGPTGPKIFPTLKAAKAAAQADYERRILSTLTAEPAAPEGRRDDEPRAYIVHAPEDDYYGTGPDRLQFCPLAQHDMDNGYRQTPLYGRPAHELSGNTGELIDKMAEAIRGDTVCDDTPWATLSEDRKIGWRGDAERALAVVKEHLTARRPADREGRMSARDLITTLEQLTGPSREVDARICAELTPEVFDAPGFKKIRPIPAFRYNPAEGVIRFDGGGIMDERFFPHVTASLDAAIALCERVLPGWTWTIDSAGPTASLWLNCQAPDATHQVAGATPAIALLIALLRAKEASNG